MGGLLIYIKHNITFTDLNIPSNINTHNTELQMVNIYQLTQALLNMISLLNIRCRHNKLNTTHQTHEIPYSHVMLMHTQNSGTH